MQGQAERKELYSLKMFQFQANQQKTFSNNRKAYSLFQNEKHLQTNCHKSIQNRQNNRSNDKLKNYQRFKIIKEQQQLLKSYAWECQRLEIERKQLLEKRDRIKQSIEQLRCRRLASQIDKNSITQECRLINLDYQRNMMMEIHYQGGIDINPDNMTYQELLQLEEEMGKVSKGLNSTQMNQMIKIPASQQMLELCSICYQNVREEEEVFQLQCSHIFHCDCIKKWLIEEKVCPMCKQQIELLAQN